ncbi:DPP4-like protein [Mya arenaria]|uniref:DPP4-like protein n=1 Tax=Mya arenaria TaxID=6604 RepID=A0ABY7EI11_MYAAR|nr:DPP4-like protein [Mya arenaria]
MFGDAELVGTTEEKRNWRGIVIALLVIVTVLALIVTAIILVTPRVDESFIFRDRNGAVMHYDCEDNSTFIIVGNNTFVFVQYNDIFFSQDPVVGDLEQLTFDGFEDVETLFNGVPDWLDHYLYAVTWKDHSHVLATWMNRAQNLSVLYMCPIDGGSCKKFHFSMFTPDASSYFLLIPHRDGAAGSFQHIAMTKPGDGSKIFLTGGRWDVVDIVGYDDQRKWAIHGKDTCIVITLEDNTELRKMLEDFSLPVQEYGAPGTQLITEEFSIGWEHYLCSTHSIIIVSVDGRGTGGRGNMWKHSVYKQLGQLEVDDTITAARYFNSLHYSYGGFLTASVIARGTEAFKCGLAVAPVTDWRYYDTAYTERYMGLPTARDNLAAYNAVNISKHASNFKSSRFMLIHGTADDASEKDIEEEEAE